MQPCPWPLQGSASRVAGWYGLGNGRLLLAMFTTIKPFQLNATPSGNTADVLLLALFTVYSQRNRAAKHDVLIDYRSLLFCARRLTVASFLTCRSIRPHLGLDLAVRTRDILLFYRSATDILPRTR